MCNKKIDSNIQTFPPIKVSIIIPVYNAEHSIEKCIASCLNQTIKEIEIILIDDCSTDNSIKILKEYEKRYPEIIHTFFCTNNGRQGTARNIGIRLAKGEYLAFVDADDWIEPNMCEILYNEASANDADMAGGNIFIDKAGVSYLTRYRYITSELGENNKRNVGEYSYFCGLFPTRIYRRSMIVNNNICFLEGVSYEDSYFNYLTALYANKVMKVEQAFYHYVYNLSSTTKKRNDVRQYDRLYVIQKTYDECKKRSLYDIFSEEVDFKYYYMLEGAILPFKRNFDVCDVGQIVKISEMIKNNTPMYYKNQYYKILNKKSRFLLFVTVNFPKFVAYFPLL